jgi:hypothetical protein
MAGFLRRWVQTTALFESRRGIPLPDEYITAFQSSRLEDSELFLEGHTHLTELVGWVAEFSQGAPLEPVVVVSDPGAGKSIFLRRLQQQSAVLSLDVKLWKVPHRITDVSICQQELGSVFGLTEGEDLTEFLSRQPPTVLLIEDLHFLFLARVGGFRALIYVLELFRSLTGQIYLISTCQRNPFEYLSRALQPKVEMPLSIYLSRFSDTHLRELILSRHRHTGYTFRFDRDIYGASSESELAAGLDQQFFQILWEQSQGNLKTASILWLKSLEADPDTPNGVVVGVPPPVKSRLFLEALDDELFLLVSLVRHGALTKSEISSITGQSLGRVNSTLSRWSKAGVLNGVNDRYEIEVEFYVALVRYLKGRNFLNAN